MTNFRFCILFYVFCLLLSVSLATVAKGEACTGETCKTKHNLSVSGPGPIKAVSETQICIFCHTPHNAQPQTPLWNHNYSEATAYTYYSSPTLKSVIPTRIDGSSMLCLGCHDGTIALGAVASRQENIQMNFTDVVDASGRLQAGAAGYLGTDLSGGHPISIKYDDILAGERNADPNGSTLRLPSAISPADLRVHLYPTPGQGGSGVQCPSCHDPHENRSTYWDEDKKQFWPPLWRKATHDDVCLVCHDVWASDFGHDPK